MAKTNKATIHRWNRMSAIGCSPAYGRCGFRYSFRYIMSPNTVTRTINPAKKK